MEIINRENYVLQVNRKNIKNAYIRIEGPGQVKISIPRDLSLDQLEDLLDKRAAWIGERLGQLEGRILLRKPDLVQGEEVYLFARPLSLRIDYQDSPRRSIGLEGNQLVLAVGQESSQAQLEALVREFYRQELLDKAQALLATYEERMGLKLGELRTRDMKTRWGSCNRRASRIWLNLQLAQLPLDLVEYVLVHELNHLRYPGHGRDFYRGLAQFSPNYIQLEEDLDQYIIV